VTAQDGRLTVRQAAEMVQVSRDVLYTAIAAGELPHIVIAGVSTSTPA
jgi:excisionase family DNA binding protein